MSLKTGTILLGVLNLIGAIIGACASLGILIFWVWYGEANNQAMKDLQGLTDQLRELNNQLGGEDKEAPEAPPNIHNELISKDKILLYEGLKDFLSSLVCCDWNHLPHLCSLHHHCFSAHSWRTKSQFMRSCVSLSLIY